MKRLGQLFLVLLAAGAAWYFLGGWIDPSSHFRERDPSIRMDRIEPYELVATVLATQWYRTGKEALVSPLDLVLAWGPLDRPETLEDLEIQTSYRYYNWYADQATMRRLGRRTIVNHTANVHVIPENFLVQESLSALERGDRVRLIGYLVDARSPELGVWRTSRTRSDEGPGACELFLVLNAEKL